MNLSYRIQRCVQAEQAVSRLHLLPRLRTLDGLQTYDIQTADAAGAFLIGELERLDQTLHQPLVTYTWSRDIELRTDVSMADENSSFTNSNFASPSGVPGSNKAWLGKDANAIVGVSLDIGKTLNPLNIWSIQLGWTIPELISSQKLGRAIDSQKFDAMQIKFNMDTDEQVYIGDTGLGLKGLLNHGSIITTGNAVTGTWSIATVAQILADINELLNAVWSASGFKACPADLLLPPKQFSLLASTIVSSAGNQSVLTYLANNTISLAINGKPLNIRPLKWLTGTTAGGVGPGAAGKDRMVAYTNQRNYVRFPLVPMQRTPLEYRDLRQLTTYFCRLGAVEMVYGETVGYRDGI